MSAESIKEGKISNKKGREKGDGRVKVRLKREECGSRVQRGRAEESLEARG